MAPPTKEAMRSALLNANVNVPNSATVTQIRALYHEMQLQTIPKTSVNVTGINDGNESDTSEVDDQIDEREPQVPAEKPDELMELNRQLEILQKKKGIGPITSRIKRNGDTCRTTDVCSIN